MMVGFMKGRALTPERAAYPYCPIPSSMNVPASQENDPPVYKLYKQRFVGLFGMVCLSMSWRKASGLMFD